MAERESAGGIYSPSDEPSAKAVAYNESDPIPPTSVSHPHGYQGVTLWLGDGPVIVDDTIPPDELREYVWQPITRRVVAARLRAIADVLEGAS